ncbi:hypothetical protein LCGC14_1209720 [marine sediment metagenome]|uniref:Uncharacterized protein n=1 Tax=marine sediment metagenome TaxID=412755 RepID=A0A0F9J151_9ZZZZ
MTLEQKEVARNEIEIVKRAREQWASDDLKIRDNSFAESMKGGAWVQAWVWVKEVED